MRITSGEVRLTATSEHVESHHVEERLDAWEDPPPPTDRVSVSQAPAPDAAPPLDVRRLILERVFGVKAPSPTSVSEPPQESAPPREDAPARAGFGVRYARVEEDVEAEHLSVQAQGHVTTADGRELTLALSLEQARQVTVRSERSLQLGDARRVDPLALDLDGDGVRLAAARHEFDLDADGSTEQVHQLAGADAWLARDLNADGRIGDGRELFGPTSGDGFAELRALDADGNGFLDEGDPAFHSLRLWSPGTGALTSLAEAGLGALALTSVRSPWTLDGGAVRETGVYLREDGTAGALQHVDLDV